MIAGRSGRASKKVVDQNSFCYRTNNYILFLFRLKIDMLTDASIDSTDAIPSTAVPRLLRRLDYLSDESEIIVLGLTDEEVELKESGFHDEDELTSEVH